MRYGIPGLVLLLGYIFNLVGAIYLLARRRLGFGFLRRLLNQTTVGRAVTMDRAPDAMPCDAKTTDWIRQMGNEDIGIRKSDISKGYECPSEQPDPKEPVPV